MYGSKDFGGLLLGALVEVDGSRCGVRSCLGFHAVSRLLPIIWARYLGRGVRVAGFVCVWFSWQIMLHRGWLPLWGGVPGR